MQELMINIGKAFCFVLLALTISWLARIVFDLLTKKIDEDKEIISNNFAIGYRRAGQFLGGLIAMAGVLGGQSHTFAKDLYGILVYGLLAYVLIFIAGIFNDKSVLSDINNDDACRNNNKAVGITEFASSVATGLIINGCMAGDSSGLLEGITLVLFFFVIGQGLILLLVNIFHKFSSADCVSAIEKGNIAAAIYLSGKIITYAIILRAALLQANDGWVSSLEWFLGGAIVGLLFLAFAGKFVEKILLPRGAGQGSVAMLIEQAAMIGVALLISVVL